MDAMAHKHLDKAGKYGSIRELVFGIEDSLVSTLGVVIGMAAGTEDARIVILSGAIIVVVEALSMAAGSYVSSKSHRQMLEQAIKEEEREIEEDPERETEELRAMYRTRGFSPDEVEILVRRITSDKKLWLEEMTMRELRIGGSELDEPGKNAWVMFVSYALGGLIPVAPFFFLAPNPASLLSTGLTVIALFSLGYWKGKVTENDGIRSGIEMTLICASAAGAGYLIGKVVGKAFGIDAG